MKPKVFSMLLLTACLLSACGQSVDKESWTTAYDVVGTEHTQLWDLKADDFLAQINSASPEDMQLSYLKEYDPSSMNCMLTQNGETWKINLSVFPSSEADTLTYKDEANASDWINNIGKVELSLYSDSEETSKENGTYVREIISIFTPGAEEIVENAIGLYGEPEKEAVISEGVYRVSIDSVAYTYIPNQNKFTAQPHIELWPEENTTPSVIKPD